MGYFPRFTEPYQRRMSEWEWDNVGPSAFRKVAFSLLDMALITGILLRVGRAVVLVNAGASGVAVAAGFMLSALFLFAMTAVHLGNFPLRHWIWRAPAFGALVAVVESAVSFVLIALGREPYGSGPAMYADWPSMAISTLSLRLAAVIVFAIVLAAVVQWVRVKATGRAQRL